VWALKAEGNVQGHGWISSATSTTLNHLQICALVSVDVQSMADEDHRVKAVSDSPTSRQR
jgi:hypothetical protein